MLREVKENKMFSLTIPQSTTHITLVRAVFGKKSTPIEKREYTIEGSNSSAVGTIDEVKKLLPNLKVIKIRDRINGDKIIRLK
jgi:hypothetical protein